MEKLLQNPSPEPDADLVTELKFAYDEYFFAAKRVEIAYLEKLFPVLRSALASSGYSIRVAAGKLGCQVPWLRSMIKRSDELERECRANNKRGRPIGS
jgi:hypothetical protein